ncbi:hypothetical protein [Acetobacter sp. LMG 32666]|uniref:hypothetical protein n=1 Tax=Acetobacter sp. LMG 32666 TaxID=2959295 RepID=UPI0030C7A86E
MYGHQAVQTAQAETANRWREAVRERWRITLLSAWERETLMADGKAPLHIQKTVFLKQKARMTRCNAGCK